MEVADFSVPVGWIKLYEGGQICAAIIRSQGRPQTTSLNLALPSESLHNCFLFPTCPHKVSGGLMKLLSLLLGYQWASSEWRWSHTWVTRLTQSPSKEWQTEEGPGVRRPSSVGVCVSGPLCGAVRVCVRVCVSLAFALPTFPDFTRQISGSCIRRLCRPSRPILISGSHGERRTQDAQGVKK